MSESPLPPLEEQLNLFAGVDAWNFPGVPSHGYPPIQVADCGHGVTLVAPPYGSATCFPTSVGMAASWNRELIEEVGAALGRETRAKNCAMLLGPMVNLHRIPCGGRNYETFSEDPVLTGKMASAIIRGIQSEGTAACIKSFACNNQQHAQDETSSEVDERTLREIYFKVFAVAFRESNPWAVMTSYNLINGEYPGDSYHWMEEVLRQEMGFDGFIVSDWRALQGEGAIKSGVDMEMPGPGKVLKPDRLRDAIARGLIDEAEIERRTRRVLALHEKCTPAREGKHSPPELDSPRHRDVARRAAEEALVLLKNEGGVLPLDRKALRRIAVIGPNAALARLGGGGSASVSPFYSVSPLDGVRALVGDDVEVLYAEGCSQGSNLPTVPGEFLSPPDGQFGQGLKAEYFMTKGYLAGEAPVVTKVDEMVSFSWGWASPATGLPRNEYVVRWTGKLNLTESGKYQFSLSTQEGIGRVIFDGETVIDCCWADFDENNFESAYANHSGECEIEIDSPREVEVIVEYRKTKTRGGAHFGWTAPFSKDPIEEAVELAQKVDAVIIAAGLSNQFEGGAYDRRFFELPGRQAELIERVAAANEKTAVVLKNGSVVSFNGWLDKVPAVIEAHYPGQEGGTAIARALFGEVNPSGKLPDTIPNSWEEVPAMKYYPGENHKALYGEKLLVGYRYYDASGVTPKFPFGFGLSYTTFAIDEPKLTGVMRDGGEVELKAAVTNTGNRAGKEVVQVYLEWRNPLAGRPPRALIDFAKVALEPGETKTVTFNIPYRELLTYNPDSAAWELEHRDFNICVGNSSRSLQRVALPLE